MGWFLYDDRKLCHERVKLISVLEAAISLKVLIISSTNFMLMIRIISVLTAEAVFADALQNRCS